MNSDWTGKIQVILLSGERNCAHFQNLLGRSNRYAFWENEGKIHERECVKGFFSVNFQAGISQLHYRLVSSQMIFRDFKYLLRF